MENNNLQNGKPDILFYLGKKKSELSSGERREKVIFMQQVLVKFEDVDQVRDFVNAVSMTEANFELGSGSRIVDAKSILGVFALDLAQPQRLVCDSDDSAILEEIEPFLVREDRLRA